MAKKGARFINNDGEIINSEESTARLGSAEVLPEYNNTPEVYEETWETIIKSWIKNVLIITLVGVLGLAALYSGLTATLMMYVPVTEDSGRVWVARGTWADNGGIPNIGDQAVISTTTALPTNTLNLIETGWFGINEPAVVKIVSEQYITLSYDTENQTVSINGDATVDDEPISSSLAFNVDSKDNTDTITLTDQFLAECVAGSCEEGTYLIVNENQIYGEPANFGR